VVSQDVGAGCVLIEYTGEVRRPTAHTHTPDLQSTARLDPSLAPLRCGLFTQVITPEECNARMSRMDNHDDFYFASLGGGLMLDAKAMGSVARFANHSCDPNCELQVRACGSYTAVPPRGYKQP